MTSSIRLDGKVAIVTGATQGIGRAISLDLASRGVHVIGTARNPEPAAELSAAACAAGGQFTFIQGDVGTWSGCKEVAEAAIAVTGRADILINNAGISRPHCRMDAIEEDMWRAVSSSTLEGTIAMTRYVLPTMIAQQDGVILHIASVSAISGLNNMGSYCMAKAAVMHHAKVVAIENLVNNVRCNALLVGATETEAMKLSLASLAEKRRAAGDANAGTRAHHGSLTTLQPEDLARSVTLLCLPEAREINGAAIAVDRGFSAGLFNSRYNELSAAGQIPAI
jgi:3-oxoacyl-[acyl-carrier protein] reductase